MIDVRRRPAFSASREMIGGALRRDPEQVASVGEGAAFGGQRRRVLRARPRSEPEGGRGVEPRPECRPVTSRAASRKGGRRIGGPLDAKPANASTRWVTRERPKIDRIACPWLISRFVDPDAEFLYVPAAEVLHAAKEKDAIPYDVPDVHFSHDGDSCSFDAFLKHYRLDRSGACTISRPSCGARTPRSWTSRRRRPGSPRSRWACRATSQDDHEMLGHGMVMYDALYTWCKEGKDEVHTWNPQAYR